MAKYLAARKRMNEKKIKVFPTIEELNKFAVDEFVRLSREAIEKRGQFTVVLSGGSTPKKLYALLASDEFRSKIDWQKIYFFFGDERNVLPDSEESNFKMVNEAMFSKLPILPKNIHRFETENGKPETVAQNYVKEMVKSLSPQQEIFEMKPFDGVMLGSVANSEEREKKQIFFTCFPRFDLIFLGMGADGHTASLFPDTAALNQDKRIAAENFVPLFNDYRYTLTFPTINYARNIIFLIAGEDKAETLKEVLEGTTKKYPSQKVNPQDGNLMFLVDKEAAKLLS